MPTETATRPMRARRCSSGRCAARTAACSESRSISTSRSSRSVRRPRPTFPRSAAASTRGVLVPGHAEVANAVGAVAARVVQNADVVVTTPEEAVTACRGTRRSGDFATLEAALEHAETSARGAALERALAAGATDVTVEVTREVREAARDDGHVMHIETRIRATAFGNPSLLARE